MLLCFMNFLFRTASCLAGGVNVGLPCLTAAASFMVVAVGWLTTINR